MKGKEFESIMSEIRELRTDVRDTRDGVGALRTDLSTFKATTNQTIKDLTDKQKWSTRIYTVIGGAVAVTISKFMGH